MLTNFLWYLNLKLLPFKATIICKAKEVQLILKISIEVGTILTIPKIQGTAFDIIFSCPKQVIYILGKYIKAINRHSTMH